MANLPGCHTIGPHDLVSESMHRNPCDDPREHSDKITENLARVHEIYPVFPDGYP